MGGYDSNRALKVRRVLEAAPAWMSTPEVAAALDCFTGDVIGPLNRLVSEGRSERQKVGKCWCWRAAPGASPGTSAAPTA